MYRLSQHTWFVKDKMSRFKKIAKKLGREDIDPLSQMGGALGQAYRGYQKHVEEPTSEFIKEYIAGPISEATRLSPHADRPEMREALEQAESEQREMLQTAGEMAIDPMSLLPGGAPAKGVMRAVKKIPGLLEKGEVPRLYARGLDFGTDPVKARAALRKAIAEGKMPEGTVLTRGEDIVRDIDITPEMPKTKEVEEDWEKLLKQYQSKKHTQLKKAKPDEFHSAIGEAQRANPRIEEFVHRYSPEELKDMKTFLTADKQSGFAVKPDGDIVSVFSAAKGRGDELVDKAIEMGGTKLDAFDGYLTKELYPRHGFVEYKREPNWTPGEPDVVYMKLDPKLRKQLRGE